MDGVVERKSQRPLSDPMSLIIPLSSIVFTPPPLTGQTPGQEKPPQIYCITQGTQLSILYSPKGEENWKKNRYTRMCVTKPLLCTPEANSVVNQLYSSVK